MVGSMAPRRSNQEGDVSAGFVEEQVANIEHGQASDAVAGGNGGAEILVGTAPGGDLGEAVGGGGGGALSDDGGEPQDGG
ncbi:unnamed protein product [Linum trigynum]|uniref:Uncharacterized protein n=1 Tax=Linum trigynum TaxID=586398 RepID=A0AAV2GI98_9ROSI